MSLDDLCQEAKDAGVEAPEDFTVRLVTDIGKVDDRTFNQYAYEGMEAAADCFGFETDFIETASRPTTPTNIATALEGDPDVHHHRRLPARRRHRSPPPPRTRTRASSASTSSRPSSPPTTSASSSTRTRAATWPACWPPALSESGVIGVVGGREDVPPVVKLVNGYEAGAKSVNPDIQVL